MKKIKKLVLARNTLRILGSLHEAGIVGGISGPRGCHTIDDICPPPATDFGATCNDTAQENCHTGLGSQCHC
jgi:hypothetical protein